MHKLGKVCYIRAFFLSCSDRLVRVIATLSECFSRMDRIVVDATLNSDPPLASGLWGQIWGP
jgi:hypothetical protein